MDEIPRPEFTLPIGIYALYVFLAFVIGDTSSCYGGQEVYALVGLVSLPILIWIPFHFGKGHSWITRTVMAIVYPLLGIAVWAWAFVAGHMVLMCRLF